MPSKPGTACRPPCPGVVREGVCSVCGPRRRQRPSTPSAASQGGRAWRELRDRKRRLNPLCEACEREGRVTPAEEIHHLRYGTGKNPAIVPIEWLESLCLACHAKATGK